MSLAKVLVCASLAALAACAPAGDRAPKHASQSRPGPTSSTQLVLTDEMRAGSEAYVKAQLQMVTQLITQNAANPVIVGESWAMAQPAQDHQFAIEFAAGKTYAVLGVCDGDCGDVDLEVLDGQTGAVLGSDLEEDDFPVVVFRPEESGRRFVRLILKACRYAPCMIGGRVLEVPADAVPVQPAAKAD